MARRPPPPTATLPASPRASLVLGAGYNLMRLGMQYYVSARGAARANLMPVTGNLYHHAIEMMLKALLSRTLSLKTIGQKQLGHKLLALWTAFKAEFPDADLREFDTVIGELDHFERLRYPDSMIAEGAQMYQDWRRGDSTIATGPGAESVPSYRIVINDIDFLVAKIFEMSKSSPAFYANFLNEHAKAWLSYENPMSAFLLGVDSA